MGFGFKQPLVGEKRCVTTLITAAKETRGQRVNKTFFIYFRIKIRLRQKEPRKIFYLK